MPKANASTAPPKPAACSICGAELDQPDTGRPRTYCSTTCRRMRERRLKAAEQLLVKAMKAEQDARYRYETSGYHPDPAAARWWAAEVERRTAELRDLLAAGDDQTGDDDDQAHAAASLLARRRTAG